MRRPEVPVEWTWPLRWTVQQKQVAGYGPNKAGSHVLTGCKKETSVPKKGLNSERFGCPAWVCLLHLFSASSCFSACQNSVDLKWHQVLIINLRPSIQNGCFGNVSVTCLLSVPRATLMEGRRRSAATCTLALNLWHRPSFGVTT